MAVVYVDKKPVTLDDEIVGLGVDAVRAALAVDFPGVENADIRIEQPKAAGAPATVTVSKRAAPKSAPEGQGDPLPAAVGRVLEALAAAPDYVNPAILMAAAVMQADARGDAEFLDRAARRGDVERAVAAGEREQRAVHKALAKLGHAKPTTSKFVPLGF